MSPLMNQQEDLYGHWMASKIPCPDKVERQVLTVNVVQRRGVLVFALARVPGRTFLKTLRVVSLALSHTVELVRYDDTHPIPRFCISPQCFTDLATDKLLLWT